MNVVYTMDRGRMNSVDLDGTQSIARDNAELLTDEQVKSLLKDNSGRKVMSEDDWFSY